MQVFLGAYGFSGSYVINGGTRESRGMYRIRALVPVETASSECNRCGEGKLEYALVRSTRGGGSWFAFHCRACSTIFDAQEPQELHEWVPDAGAVAEPSISAASDAVEAES